MSIVFVKYTRCFFCFGFLALRLVRNRTNEGTDLYQSQVKLRWLYFEFFIKMRKRFAMEGDVSIIHSGCHWTPAAKGWSSNSIASMIPSDAAADIFRCSPN